MSFNLKASGGLIELAGNIDLSLVPTDLADLEQDTTHRTVTDAEKSTWNGKQDTLIAGDNITITGNTISASGGGGDVSGKMDKENPTGTGYFALNMSDSKLDSIGDYAFASGYHNVPFGKASHAEGEDTVAYGEASHVEGIETSCSQRAKAAHVEGSKCSAEGAFAHAEGWGTRALGTSQHVQGRYNKTHDENDNIAFVIGNGTSITNRSDAMTVSWDGDLWVCGDITDGSGNTLSSLASTVGTVNAMLEEV